MKKIWAIRFNTSYEKDLIKTAVQGNNVKLCLSVGNTQIIDEKFISNEGLVQGIYAVQKLSKSLKYLDLTQFRNILDLVFRSSLKDSLNAGVLKKAVDYYFNFWQEKINHDRPDLVVFWDTPHMAHEHVLMSILEQENINYCSFKFLSGGRTYLTKNNKYYNCNRSEESFLSLVQSRNFSDEDDMKYMSKNLNRIFYYLLKLIFIFVRDLFKKYREKYSIGYNLTLFERKHPLTYFQYNLIRIKLVFLSLVGYFCELLYADKKIPDKRFLYIPLVTKYECTVQPSWNGEDVIDVVDQLIPKLRSDEIIVIKEHPQIYRFRDHQNYVRPLSFYKQLSKYKKVKIIHHSVDTKHLLRKAHAIICGSKITTLQQAVKMEKPVYIIGENPFHPILKSYEEYPHKDNTVRDYIGLNEFKLCEVDSRSGNHVDKFKFSNLIGELLDE